MRFQVHVLGFALAALALPGCVVIQTNPVERAPLREYARLKLLVTHEYCLTQRVVAKDEADSWRYRSVIEQASDALREDLGALFGGMDRGDGKTAVVRVELEECTLPDGVKPGQLRYQMMIMDGEREVGQRWCQAPLYGDTMSDARQAALRCAADIRRYVRDNQ